MKISKEAFLSAKTLAEPEGYDRIVFYEVRDDCIIYSVSKKADRGLIIGWPFFVIVDSELNARFAGHKEVWGW